MTDLSNYLKKFTDDERNERLQEFIDEANRMIEAIGLKDAGPCIYEQFLIWNFSCYHYFQHHREIFVGMQDYFARTGVVPLMMNVFLEDNEVEQSLLEKIQTELIKRLDILIGAKQILSPNLPLIKITERGISVVGKGEVFYMTGKLLKIVLILKRKMPEPVPMRKLAELVGYSDANHRKVSDDKSEINKEFRERFSMDTDLVVRLKSKGYSLNSENLKII